MGTRTGDPVADEVVSAVVRGRPSTPLRPFLASYDGYRQRGVGPAQHRGLPSPFLTVIFTLDESLTIAQHVDPRQSPAAYDALVGGMHTSPALITHDGAQSGIQLRLRPLAARALLGLPAGELAGLDLPADAVLGPDAEEVHGRLQAARTWPERFAALDHVLGRRLSGERTAPDQVQAAWRHLLRTGGTASVSDLARQVGWSERHLATWFRTEVGLTPKAAARVIRFSRARRLLEAGSSRGQVPALARLAADCGFYDQSHLVREFGVFAGCSPTRWLADEFGIIQAGTAGGRQG